MWSGLRDSLRGALLWTCSRSMNLPHCVTCKKVKKSSLKLFSIWVIASKYSLVKSPTEYGSTIADLSIWVRLKLCDPQLLRSLLRRVPSRQARKLFPRCYQHLAIYTKRLLESQTSSLSSKSILAVYFLLGRKCDVI